MALLPTPVPVTVPVAKLVLIPLPAKVPTSPPTWLFPETALEEELLLTLQNWSMKPASPPTVLIPETTPEEWTLLMTAP